MSSSVGQSVPVADARERVTGQVDYVLNFELPGMLHGRILRSPHPHAKLLRIDAEQARHMPGVLAVLTGPELMAQSAINPRYGRIYRDQTIVATDVVRFAGEPVAAVAALDDDLAQEALDSIQVEYEPVPAVFDPEDALAPTAPVLHQQRVPEPAFTTFIGTSDPPNACGHFKLRRGDVQRGFAEADFVFEDTFRSPAVQHVPLEPHVTVAEYKGGGLTIWTSSQMPNAVRSQMAAMFNLPATKVRVITFTLGGGYGAKGGLRLEPIASTLAWLAGRPVRIVTRREEEFVTVCKHPATIHLKTGVNRDGTLVARQATCYYNTGAYADVGPVVARNAGSAMAGPYKTPHVWVDSYAVWTNLVSASAFRGFGVPQGAWAYESQMDMIAQRLGLDPLELRRRNVLHEGDQYATGETLADLHYDELLDRARAAVDWQPDDARWLRSTAAGSEPGSPQLGAGTTRRGKGLSCVIKATITPSTSTALAMLNDDGSLQVLTSSVEMGQGAKTVLAQLAAEAADVPYERVQVSEPDTEVTPYDQQTSSSRTTYSMGRAVVQAAREVKAELLDLAAELLEAPVDDLVTHDGTVEVRGVPGRSLTYSEVVRRAQRGNLLGQGTFVTKGGLDADTGQGIGSVHWHQGAASCEVEVDTETGKVQILKLHSSVFAGRMVNPRLCELQTEGSAFFGLGQALFEEMLYDDGRLVNANLADYMIPSFEDVAGEISVAVLEEPGSDEIHGLGETSLPPVMPAVANAVYNAVGARITDLPLTPEKVLSALNSEER